MLKKYVLSVIMMLLFGMLAFAKKDFGKINGYWMNEKQDLIIYIYEDHNHIYHGKVVWMADSLDEYNTPRRDVMNNDAGLRSRKLLGMNILSGYKFDKSDNEWDGGRIYNFENGNTYRGKMWVNEAGELRVRGHWWILWFLSRTKTWTRAIPPDLMDAIVRRK